MLIPMRSASERSESIVRFIERIAPSERGAVAIYPDQNGGFGAIAWNLLPPSITPLQLVVSADTGGGLFAAAATLAKGQEPSYTEPVLIASLIHTDDEIARKVLVHGAVTLENLRLRALGNQELEFAQYVGHYHDLILEGLEAWGAGTTSKYSRPSPRLRDSFSEAAATNGDTTALATQTELATLRQVGEQKSRVTTWIAINIVMIVIAIVVSVGTYAAAEGGGTYLIWWGPVVWGVVNLFRFGSRLSKLTALEREIGG